MKKAFNLKFLALSALLMLGNAVAFATPRDWTYGPADGTAVGATLTIGGQKGLVTYRVTDWDETNDFYTVKITGFDADGLDKLAEARAGGAKINLSIPVTFEEKFGENKYKYAVTEIAKGLDGTTPQSFYGLIEIDNLTFVDGTDYNGVALDKFSYTVGEKAFYGCTNMKTLTFTSNCKTIGAWAFQNSAIKTFTIPAGCETIGEYAFYDCKKLSTINVAAAGNTVMHTLGTHVFGNSALEILDLRNATQLWTISGEPFMYELSVVNDVLKRVLLPVNLKAINTAFAKCTALVGFGLPAAADDVIYTDFGYTYDAAKVGEGNLDKTSLGKALDDPTGSPVGQHIINGAFAGCRSLAQLDFPDCDINSSPFVGCTSLKNITFPAGYSHTIYATAIANQNLFGINVDTNPAYVAADQNALEKILFKGAMNGIIANNAFVGCTNLGEVEFVGELQNGTNIGAAFTNVTSLTSLKLNGINTAAAGNVLIGADAFKNTGITALDFKTVKITKAGDITIENGAFSDCAHLATIAFGALTVEKVNKVNIQGGAFTANPELTSVTFGNATFNESGRVNIYDDAFGKDNVKLETVTFGTVASKDAKTGTIFIGADANTDLATPDLAADALAANANIVFGDGEHLKTVEFGKNGELFGDLVTGMFISSRSFASTGLQTVTFGNIKAANKAGSTGFIIAEKAFVGGDVADKAVKIGNLSDNVNGGLGFVVMKDAFAAKMLKSVVIGNIDASIVSFQENSFANATKADYDTNSEVKLGTQNLQTVKIGNITAGIANSNVAISEAAFWGGKAADKSVEIGTISDNTTKHTTLAFHVFKNAFAAEKLKSVEFAKLGMSASSITVEQNAFANVKNGLEAPATQNLQTVTLGNITASNEADATLLVYPEAFWGGNVADKTVTIGTISDKATDTKHTTSVTIYDNAFAGQSLKTVGIGDMSATKIEIGENAFANKKNTEADAVAQNLQTVTLGNITAGNGASTFEAKKEAFWGGKTAAKSVTVGNITDGTAPATLTASFGEAAAAGEQLTNVKIGNMTATSVAIGEVAFSGAQLINVDLGDMTAATLTVGANAFANSNENDVLNETIKIGELKTANFTAAKAFQGPTKAGSSYAVKIKSITGDIIVPENTFVAPAIATAASYTIEGEVSGINNANIIHDAFCGSKDAEGNNITVVKIQGDYKKSFEWQRFNKVDSVEVAVAADGKAMDIADKLWLNAFEGAKTVIIGNNCENEITGNLAAAIEKVIFVGSVTGKSKIRNFTSSKVRLIEFKNVKVSGVKVDQEVIEENAFAPAANAVRAANQNITVIYREEQTREAKNIFKKNLSDGSDAFRSAIDTDDDPVVTLYTTEWTKANIYESTSAALNWKVYRLTFSESEVAPGEEIVAQISKKDGQTYGYAKLYIPKGVNMKYKVAAKYDATADKNAVQLYYGRIDNSNNKIYMYNLPVIDDYYWIDATDVDQAFVLRTNSTLEPATSIKAVPVTAEEDAIFTPGDADHYYFNADLAVQNQLRYATAEIANQELKNNEEFVDRDVYYMANPKNHGFAFTKFDKSAKYTSGDNAGEYKTLAKKSLYIVGKKNVSGAAELEIVFEGDDNFDPNFTGIENVKNAELNNDAIYNLQGVRVNKAQKGIFIMNGKKFVVK
jgi:hypothetical protein